MNMILNLHVFREIWCSWCTTQGKWLECTSNCQLYTSVHLVKAAFRSFFRFNIELDQARAPQRCATISRPWTLSTEFMSRHEGKSGGKMESDGYRYNVLGALAYICVDRRIVYGRWDLRYPPCMEVKQSSLSSQIMARRTLLLEESDCDDIVKSHFTVLLWNLCEIT
jgi:hypothetical protein